jgi:D-arabinose 1-dehydrogenase-like Zn-dependent alcohol dehydrogenase
MVCPFVGATCLRPVGTFQRCHIRQIRRHTTLIRALDPDNASVLIAGGAGVGMHTTRKLKDMGAWVYMMQRSDKLRSEIEAMMAVCVKGDALDAESVSKVMKGTCTLLTACSSTQNGPL